MPTATVGESGTETPFREGNGRSQLSFTSMLGERAGYPLEFARVRRDTFLPAMIASFAGDLAPLVSELRHLLHRSEEHTSELQSLMRISYAVFCLKKKKN